MASAFDKFRQLETTFNKNYLECLLQLKEMFEDDPQAVFLDLAYERWYGIISANQQTMEGCRSFHEAVKDSHEMLLKRDENLFTADGDFFEKVYQVKGIDSLYLYESMSDGSDTEDPINNDAKGNLWEVIIGLYRLSVLLCIYLKMPLVKEIIDMILMDNPDLNQTNIVDKIFKDFRGKRKLRQLIMKLLKSKSDNFTDIFSSLQRVVASFSTEVTMDASKFGGDAAAAAQKLDVAFTELLSAQNVEEMKSEDRLALMKALEAKDETTKSEFVTRGMLSSTQLKNLETQFFARNMHKSMNVSKVVKDLGATMEKMMGAIQSGSEDDMQKVFEEAGTGMCFDGVDLGQFKNEMSGEFEKEFEEMDADPDEEPLEPKEPEQERDDNDAISKPKDSQEGDEDEVA
jgi:hypothetical protein